MSVSMTMNGAVLPVHGLLHRRRRGAGRRRATSSPGTIQNDILKEFAVRNTYIYPPEPSMRIVADIIAYCAAEMPKFNSHLDLAAITCTRPGRRRCRSWPTRSPTAWNMSACAQADGLDIDDFAPRLSFFFGIGMNLFMEVAKLRAARTLWARIMTDLGAKTEKSKLLRTHCQTSGVSLTEQDPYNNVIRTTIEALAAVLGGTQSLHTNSFDEAIALPTDFSARIARNTQLILAEESGVTAVADPLGGSWYVEALTRELEEQGLGADRGGRGAWRHDQGGRRRACPSSGSRKPPPTRAAKVDTGETVIVGVNRYRLEEEEHLDILEVDNAKVRAGQIARLEKMRAGRDEAKARAALDVLEDGRARTTAICWRCRSRRRARAARWARFRTRWSGRSAAITPRRSRSAASMARRDDDALEGRGRRAPARSPSGMGRKPRILVAKMGQDGHDRGANLVSSAFGDLGFEVIAGPLFQTPREAAELAVEKDVDVVGASIARGGPQDADPRADRRAQGSRPRRHQGRRRRRHPAAGLRHAARGGGAGDLRAGHQPGRRGRRGAAPARPQQAADRRGGGVNRLDSCMPEFTAGRTVLRRFVVLNLFQHPFWANCTVRM